MPFGLTNAPAVFQHLMNDVFREYLDQFVVIYLDDVLIFSQNQREHEKHVRLVLEKLRSAGLYAKLEKCEFDKSSVEFLGYVISQDGISMDPRKIDTLLSWKRPNSVKEVQSFLGFANFYRIFIKDYSKTVSPLTALTRKATTFQWNLQAEEAYKTLEKCFTTAPVLAHADPSRPFVLETDGSDFALGAVLSQVQSDGQLHPVAYYSRKFTPPEINYEIYDKELLAIVASFEHWRNYLYGASHTVEVYTDHKNLLYYTTTRKLNRRQARWSLFLAEFDFVIKYRPGAQQGKPDALSRRSEYCLKEGEESVTQQNQVLIKPRMLQINAVSFVPADISFIENVKQATLNDALAKELLHSSNGVTDSNIKCIDGLVYRNGLLYVPDCPARVEILRTRHDGLLAGHFGVKKTLALVSRDYWWPGIRNYISKYVQTCDTCARSKSNRHLPHGELLPPEIPKRAWESVTMDFITDLPESEGFDSIFVVVDRFSKMAHFIPCNKAISAQKTAALFVRNVVKLHGLPENIISDRGPQFACKFWKALFNLLGVEVRLSSAFHPQTDGQSERVNQVLEQYLRCSINHLQDNWVELLPLAEFAYNNAEHSSTKQSPFFTNYAQHPRLDFQPHKQVTNPAAETFTQTIEKTKKLAEEELRRSMETNKKYADEKRTKGPDLKIGDYVWLSKKNIKTTRPSDKLDFRKLGPFKVIGQINPVTYRLQLPNTIKIHNVFHVSLLEPYNANTIKGRHVTPLPPVQVDNEVEYEVNKILDSKIQRKRLYYLVDWKGYDISERTWEPVENLSNSVLAISKFHQRHPGMPGEGRGLRLKGR